MTDLPAPDAAPLADWPGRRGSYGRWELFVRTAGSGEPAVLVHGLGGSATNWTDLMALLDDRLEMMAPDLPGHGQSPASPAGRYRLADHVAALEALLSATGRGPVHLFGNSLGGAVVTLLAARRPDLVRSLTLVSPAFPQLDPRRASDTRVAALLIPGVEDLVRRRLAKVPVDERVRAVLELCYYDSSRVHPQRLAAEQQAALERGRQPYAETAFIRSLRSLVRSYLRVGPSSLWRAAGRVQAPVLLIWGRHDKLVPATLAPRVARAFHDARLMMYEDAGHVAQMELPERTARDVRAFLDAGAVLGRPT